MNADDGHVALERRQKHVAPDARAHARDRVDPFERFGVGQLHRGGTARDETLDDDVGERRLGTLGLSAQCFGQKQDGGDERHGERETDSEGDRARAAAPEGPDREGEERGHWAAIAPLRWPWPWPCWPPVGLP